MIPSFSTFAAIRYGYGLAADRAALQSVDKMLDLLAGPDVIAKRFRITSFKIAAARVAQLQHLRKDIQENKPDAKKHHKAVNRQALANLALDFQVGLIRPMASPDGLRERLVRFWSDHFSVAGRANGLRDVTSAYREEAIRPYITGRFSDLLRHAVTHPAMLVYLDQVSSIGPNSRVGKKRQKGLNENLAREVLELHTLGVGAEYGQVDVTEFAELLTGLSYNFKSGFKFRSARAEPGAEIVLGKSYGSEKARLSDIYAALDDLARHPATADHIALKLAVHFVSDNPPERLVLHLAERFTSSDGNLFAVYSALLQHPDAWQNFGAKAKQPFDFMVSSLRALNVNPERIRGLATKQVRSYLWRPLEYMGQPYHRAPGPDGWPELLEDWITPQGMAARIQWALVATDVFGAGVEPKVLVQTALGDLAQGKLLRFIAGSQNRQEARALVLASPEFNRR